MEKLQAYISLIMAAFISIIGIPVWWNTTKTYRASLPYEEISKLAEGQDFKISVRWNILFDNEFASGPNGEFQIRDTLKEQTETKLTSFKTSLYFQSISISSEVKELVKTFDKTGKAVYDLANQIFIDHEREIFHHSMEDTKLLHYDIFFLKSDTHEKKCQILVGKQQILVLAASNQDIQYMTRCIESLVDSLQLVLYPNVEGRAKGKVSHPKDRATPVQTAAGYELSFTLANANPHDIKLNWNIENSIKNHLKPFLDEVEMFGPFIVTSQILNFVDLGTKPKKSPNGYFYSMKQIPLLLNPLETRLNTYTSNYPILNFVLYTPPLEQMPLTFQSKDTNVISFTSPRWGGVVVNNINTSGLLNSERKLPLSVSLDVKDKMLLFIAQLREFIGLQELANTDLIFSDLPKSGMLSWELNYLLLSKTLENLQKTISTLNSLAQLLEKIANIVIRDDIKRLILKAIEEVYTSRLLLKGGSLKMAFDSSKIAFVSSEKAFFDPSLLALLYFPDDQKYAIYLPLFLPICLPIFLSSIEAIIKFIRGKDKKNKID